MIGQKLGRYRILSRLGEGGMASVWEAEDTILDRRVALKVLGGALAQDADARRRFRHEAEVASLLDHPAIVPVYEHGEDNGSTYLAMLLVDGETVAQRLGRGLPPVNETLGIVAMAAAALGYAHARGVVHRDISANNIMVERGGGTRLLDFGLALVEGFSRVTRSGTRLGTLTYSAPETVRGGPADPRSDLYSLGVVLYEMLTGSPPFRGSHPDALVYALMNETPRMPSALRPALSPALDELIMHAIERDPARRFLDADAMLVALREVQHGGPGGHDLGAVGRSKLTGEILSSGEGVIYLAITPLTLPCGADDEALTAVASSLDSALRHRMATLARIHVLHMADSPRMDEDARTWAHRHGANLVLSSTVRRSGTLVRVECTLLDPEGGVALSGDVADGSMLDVFALEDAVVKCAKGLLPAGGDWHDPPRAAPQEPAANDLFAQASRYMQRHDHGPSVDAAIGLLERLSASHEANATHHAALARAYIAKYELTRQHAWVSKAATACWHAMQLDPQAPAVRLAHADLETLSGHESSGLEEYQLALEAQPELYDARLGLARLHLAHSRYAEAERECRRAVELRPRDWRGYSTLGLVFFRRGEYARAIGPWRRVMRLAPDNVRAAAHLGGAYYQLDRFEEALEVFRHALETQPDARTYTNYGTTLFTLGRFVDAAEALERAAALSPADPIMWGNLGNGLRFVPGRAAEVGPVLDRAIGLMHERLRSKPDDADDWVRLAGWLEVRAQRRESDEALERGLALAPDDPKQMVAAAGIWVLRGEFERAEQLLRRAVEAGYGVGSLARSPELAPLREREVFQSLLAPKPTQGERTTRPGKGHRMKEEPWQGRESR